MGNQGDHILFTLDSTEHIFSVKAMDPPDAETVSENTIAQRLHCSVSVGAATYFPYVHLYSPSNYATIVCEGEECGDAYLPYEVKTLSPTKDPTIPPPCVHDWCWD